MKIESYLNDGANWQAQCVLAYLRSLRETILNNTWDSELKRYNGTVEAGRFENCREQGYIVSVELFGYQRNYCFYEHRNSDDLILVLFDKLTINTPTLDDVIEAMGDNKYNYTESFGCGCILECGDYIVSDAQLFLKKAAEKNEERKAKMAAKRAGNTKTKDADNK